MQAMKCDTARVLIEFSRPGELESGEAGLLDAHLAACAHCRNFADQQRRMDTHVREAFRKVAVPPQLRREIFSRLGRQRRRARTRLLIGVAACLLALLTAWGLSIYLGRSKPDLSRLVHDRYVEKTASSAEKVENWFAIRYGRTITAPRDFDYNLLVHRDLADFQGKQVPMLLFVRAGEEARVYVLSRNQFDLADLHSTSGSLGYKVEVRRVPDNLRCVYVILYSGSSLKPFLDERKHIPSSDSAAVSVSPSTG